VGSFWQRVPFPAEDNWLVGQSLRKVRMALEKELQGRERALEE